MKRLGSVADTAGIRAGAVACTSASSGFSGGGTSRRFGLPEVGVMASILLLVLKNKAFFRVVSWAPARFEPL
jgi:hypothetical protein